MSQAYELFVPTVKHIRLIQSAMTEAIEQEKYNDKAKLLKANDEVLAYFAKYRYWWVSNSEMILDTKHGNLWQAASDGNYYDVENAKEYASQLKLAGLTGVVELSLSLSLQPANVAAVAIAPNGKKGIPLNHFSKSRRVG